MGKGGKGKASSQICLAATVPRDVRDDMTYHYQTENQAAVKAWADLIRGKGRHSLPKYFWLWSLWSGQSYRMMKNIEIIATWCQIIRLKRHQIRFWMGSAPDPARGARSAPHAPADPFPAPGLETTCLPKYVSQIRLWVTVSEQRSMQWINTVGKQTLLHICA